MGGTVEKALNDLGMTLPDAPAPAANYVPFVRTGSLLFISGQISRSPSGEEVLGTLGAGIEVAEGQRAAEICALNILAQAKAAVGDLDSIVRLVRLNGFVQATADFTQHPQVINGASNLMATVLGERGRHSRCAVGVISLPFGVAVEIDAVLEVA
ncbi:MAG TPA: RidA family protein [Methylomirabilota bacterium]|nr:RidA family protein [Methylomirabilota bacterium]